MSNFEFRGLDEFERDLVRVITEKYPNEAKAFMRKQVNDVKTQAKRDTPDDTGFTKRHWKTATKGKRGASANFIESTVTNNAQLSHLLENGHAIKNEKNGPVLGFVPGVHMLEKAVIKKDAEFNGELNAFVSQALEELEL